MRETNDHRPIVCGTDFSAAAMEAADIAAGIAQKLGTKLVLVYVDEFHGMGAVHPTLFEAARSQKSGDLIREADRLREMGIAVEERLLAGSAFDELVGAAIQSKGRLVVVGAVGHGLARRLLVGSVAERTAETCADSDFGCAPRRKTECVDSRRTSAKSCCRIRFLCGERFCSALA